MATILDYPQFYREYGIKRLNQLMNVEPLIVKALPKKSRVHHLGSYENPNIDPSDIFYLGRTNKVIVTNVPNYPDDGMLGGFTKQSFELSAAGNSFARLNQGFKYVANIKDLVVPAADLLVYNYGYLDVIYRYPSLKQSPYLAFLNKLKTVSFVINHQKEDDIQNVMVLDVPEQLIGPKALDRFSRLKPSAACMVFDTVEKCLIREVWLWLNQKTRSESFLGLLTEDRVKNMTFIFRLFDGKSVVINLGHLYSWIRGNPNLTAMSAVGQDSPEMVGRYYIKALMTMQSINSTGRSLQAQMAALSKKAEEVEDETAVDDGEEKEAVNDDDRFLQEQEQEAIKGSEEPATGLESDQSGDGGPASGPSANLDKDTQPEIDFDKEVREMDADMDALDDLDEKSLNNRQIKVKLDSSGSIEDVEVSTYDPEAVESVEDIEAMIFEAKTVDQALEDKLAKKAEEGRISSSDYRKMMKMVEGLSEQPDPYGTGKTVAEIVNITTKDLAIGKEASEIVVPDAVIDQSMNKSSLNAYDSVYNTKILNRHIVQMMQGLQKSGVIIKSHTVERRHSVTGSYDLHLIELKPIDGQPSIIRHKVPIPDEEGAFTAKGSKYIARKQIVD